MNDYRGAGSCPGNDVLKVPLRKRQRMIAVDEREVHSIRDLGNHLTYVTPMECPLILKIVRDISLCTLMSVE